MAILTESNLLKMSISFINNFLKKDFFIKKKRKNVNYNFEYIISHLNFYIFFYFEASPIRDSSLVVLPEVI